MSITDEQAASLGHSIARIADAMGQDPESFDFYVKRFATMAAAIEGGTWTPVRPKRVTVTLHGPTVERGHCDGLVEHLLEMVMLYPCGVTEVSP